jgi:hypothetical protein
MSMQERRVSTDIDTFRNAKKIEKRKFELILTPQVLNMICSLRLLLMFAIYLTDCFLQGLCLEPMPEDNHCFFHALAHQIQRYRKLFQAESKWKIGAFIGLLVHFNETNTVHILVNLDAHDMKSLRKIAADFIRENPDWFEEFFDEETSSLAVITYDLIHLCGILNLAL